MRRYVFLRGRLTDDPDYRAGEGKVVMRIGVRMPDGLAEPVTVVGRGSIPPYCLSAGLAAGMMVIVCGWADDRTTSVLADTVAARTSADWGRP